MPGCDHREVCKHEQKNNHYRSLATAIKDSILMPRTTAPRHQGAIPVPQQGAWITASPPGLVLLDQRFVLTNFEQIALRLAAWLIMF